MYGNFKWLDLLQSMLKNNNSTKHTTTGMSPKFMNKSQKIFYYRMSIIKLKLLTFDHRNFSYSPRKFDKSSYITFTRQWKTRWTWFILRARTTNCKTAVRLTDKIVGKKNQVPIKWTGLKQELGLMKKIFWVNSPLTSCYFIIDKESFFPFMFKLFCWVTYFKIHNYIVKCSYLTIKMTKTSGLHHMTFGTQ